MCAHCADSLADMGLIWQRKSSRHIPYLLGKKQSLILIIKLMGKEQSFQDNLYKYVFILVLNASIFIVHLEPIILTFVCMLVLSFCTDIQSIPILIQKTKYNTCLLCPYFCWSFPPHDKTLLGLFSLSNIVGKMITWALAWNSCVFSSFMQINYE